MGRGKRGSSSGGRRDRERPGKPKPRVKLDYIDYKDVNTLRRFVSERGKIRARRVTGLSPQQQREVATAVKRAREMALLPYVAGK